MVQARRQERATPRKKTPAQKELRKLCGGSPPAWVEQQVLGLLNRLIQHPELIICPVSEAEPPPEVKKLRRELDELLHHPPVDETRARGLAFRLAALQLDAIGPEEYETLRLCRLFQTRRPTLARYPVELWHGGRVQPIRPHVLHLMRGQVFELAGLTFLTKGGASIAAKPSAAGLTRR